jgi:hypothetical protein
MVLRFHVRRYVADGLTAVLRFSNFNLFATVYFVGTCSVLLCSVLVRLGRKGIKFSF